MESSATGERFAAYDPMTVGQWLVTLLLLSIPIVNIVLLFVWGFGEGHHPCKRNFSRAYLILLLVVLAVMVVIGLIVATVVSVSSFS